MKTPKEFTENLKKGIITMEMLELTLFSINKRAKNCRDKKNEYYQKGKSGSYTNDYSFKTVETYKEKEEEYYSQKDFLITQLLDPVCIHKVVYNRNNKVRYYDYEEEYDVLLNKSIYKNSYFDKDTGEYVEFIDVIEEVEIENYFKFYETINHSFHIPIDEINVHKSKLKIVQISNLETRGKIINDLISTQFCKKLIELVANDNYKLIEA